MARRLRALCSAIVVVACTGCKAKPASGIYPEQKAIALVALETFHQRFAARDYEAIYRDSTEGFRSHPKQDLIAAMKDTTERWGKPGRSEIKATSCFPNQVRFLVETQFDRGPVAEVLVWSIEGRRALLHQIQWYPGPVRFPDGATNECRSAG